MNRDPKIFVYRRDYSSQVEILPVFEREDGQDSIAIFSAGEWTTHPHVDGLPINPELDRQILRIRESWARKLSAELLKIFGMPEKEGTAQKLEATTLHLEDMRRLIFEYGLLPKPPYIYDFKEEERTDVIR